MGISMICFSMTGQRTGEKLLQGLKEAGKEAVLYKKSRYLADSVLCSASEWTREQFPVCEALIFLGACGIAVRSIAPMVAGKKTDPAVLVIDEEGRFVISLLSGHLGGANELALLAADILKAMPVITTATDLHHRFAVDVFAKANGCGIRNMKAAKEASAALLAGERVGFFSEFPMDGDLPEGLFLCDEKGMSLEEASKEHRLRIGIAVTIHRDCRPFEETVVVIPRVAALGMGCRKGKESQAVLRGAEDFLDNICREALFGLASIDIKKEEPAFLNLSREWSLPLYTYSADQLSRAEGAFSASSFVAGKVGVDNVCERSAVLACQGGRLLMGKSAGAGMTFALAVREWRGGFGP